MKNNGTAYFGVYFVGHDLPTAIFAEDSIAVRFCETMYPGVELEIRTVPFWETAKPMFRVYTKHLRYVGKS